MRKREIEALVKKWAKNKITIEEIMDKIIENVCGNLLRL